MGITSYEMSPHPANEAQREQAVIRSGALHATGRAELQRVVDLACEKFLAPMSSVSIVFRDWQYLIATKGMKAGVYRRSTSFCGHAIMDPDAIFCVPDATRDPRFAGNPAVTEGMELRFYAGAPIIDDNGLPLGTICVIDVEPRATISPAEAQCLETLAADIMAIFHRHALVPSDEPA